MIEDQTPAFPWTGAGINGMSLIDYFAAKAMQVMIQNNDTTFEEDAEYAYRIANYMMKEREKHNV